MCGESVRIFVHVLSLLGSSLQHFYASVCGSSHSQPLPDSRPKQQLNAQMALAFLLSPVRGHIQELQPELWPMRSWGADCWMSRNLTASEQTDVPAWLPDSPWLSTCPDATYWRWMATARPLLTLRNGLKRFSIVLFSINVTKCHKVRLLQKQIC